MKLITPENFFKALIRIEIANSTKPYLEPIVSKTPHTNSNSLSGYLLLKKYYQDREKENREISSIDLEAIKIQNTNDGVIKCAYCKKEHSPEAISFDHFIPFYLGGHDSFNNLKLSCKSCNYMKGSIHPNLMPVTWQKFQENVQESIAMSALSILNICLKMELTSEESHLVKKLISKELEWRAARDQEKDKKVVDELKEAC